MPFFGLLNRLVGGRWAAALFRGIVSHGERCGAGDGGGSEELCSARGQPDRCSDAGHPAVGNQEVGDGRAAINGPSIRGVAGLCECCACLGGAWLGGMRKESVRSFALNSGFAPRGVRFTLQYVRNNRVTIFNRQSCCT